MSDQDLRRYAGATRARCYDHVEQCATSLIGAGDALVRSLPVGNWSEIATLLGQMARSCSAAAEIVSILATIEECVKKLDAP